MAEPFWRCQTGGSSGQDWDFTLLLMVRFLSLYFTHGLALYRSRHPKSCQARACLGRVCYCVAPGAVSLCGPNGPSVTVFMACVPGVGPSAWSPGPAQRESESCREQRVLGVPGTSSVPSLLWVLGSPPLCDAWGTPRVAPSLLRFATRTSQGPGQWSTGTVRASAGQSALA